MKKLMAGFILGFCSLFLMAADEPIPFRVKRVTDRVTVFVPGQYAPPASLAVITTPKGLIVIDTLLCPSQAEQCLVEMKKVLGRDDVILVINTHEHFDHTNGNQVFKGVDIVGHESLVPAMNRYVTGIAQFIQRIESRVAQREAQMKGLAADSVEAISLAEAIRIDRQMIADLRSRFVATPPTKTFSDKLILEVGGLELRFHYFGRAHTAGDILIHVPELGLLFTGDLFHTDFISATAGAGPLEVPRWLSVLDEVFKTGKGVRTVVGGHMLVFTRDWLHAQHRYIRSLWNAVGNAKKEGLSLAEFRQRTPLEPAFTFLAPHFDLKARPNLDRHQINIQDYWRVGLVSAAAEIEKVIRQSGPDTARLRFQELQAAGEREFFIDEREFNALGYKFLYQESKAPDAVAVFEMNTKAFPESWNVWDSLGEAFLSQNEWDKAEVFFNKSLGLNPGSQSAKNSLSHIRGDRFDSQGQTKEPPKFKSGLNTGLKGPYLGQTPPGLEPKVFAPGIVSTAGNYEFSIAFSPDGREIYFTRRQDPGGQNTILVCRWERKGWTAPREAEFCKGFPSNEPHIIPDGKKLYFGCNRQRPGAEQPEYGIWVTERTENGWGEPHYHGPGMYVSSILRGDLYMTDVTNIAGGGLITYPLVNGVYQAPVRLPGTLNQPVPVAHAFVAPDGSYIVFDSYSRPGSQGGEGDLYVAFRNPDGSWSEARNLGDTVNTPGTNFCPMVTPDGKFLFYATCRDIYWVSAEVISKLKAEEPK